MRLAALNQICDGLMNENKGKDLIDFSPPVFKAVKSFPKFSFINPSQIWFRAANQVVILNLDAKQVNQNIEYFDLLA